MLLLASQSGGSRRRRRGVFGWLWHAITWPFRMVERIEVRVVEWYRSTRRKFRHKYRHSKVVAPLVETLVRLVVLPFQILWFLLSAPFRMFAAAASEVHTVRRKRQWMHLIQGLPALVAGFAAFVVLGMIAAQHDELTQSYRYASASALSAKNYKSARVYLQRLYQLGAETNETNYNFALALEQSGQPQRAAAIIDSLAPEDHVGFPMAHLRKAVLLASQPDALSSKDQIERIRRHLRNTRNRLSGDAPNAKFDAQAANFFLAIGDSENALLHMELAANASPEYFYELAKLRDHLGQSEQARQDLQVARDYLTREVEAHPEDEELRVKLSRTHLATGEHRKAIELLEEGLALDSNESLRQEMANTYTHLYDQLQDTDGAAVGLELLKTALEYDPHSHRALLRLRDFGGEHEEQARKLLEEMIVTGQATALAHLVLGMKDWEAENTEQAIWHMEQAHKLDPSLAGLANNLAWMLAHDQTDPDPERALQIIDSVLESHPNDLAYVETRGQIYVKLERWNEAITDLERALQVFNGDVGVHEALATAYDNLGQSGLAARHAEVADRLRTAKAPQ